MKKINEFIKNCWKNDKELFITVTGLFLIVFLAVCFSDNHNESNDNVVAVIAEDVEQEMQESGEQEYLVSLTETAFKRLNTLQKHQIAALHGQKYLYDMLNTVLKNQEQMQAQYHVIMEQQKQLLNLHKELRTSVNIIKAKQKRAEVQKEKTDVTDKTTSEDQKIMRSDEYKKQYNGNATYQEIFNRFFQDEEELKKYDIEVLQQKLKEQKQEDEKNPVIFIRQYFRGFDSETGNAVYEI